MTATNKNILKTGTVLDDKWVVLELLGKGGMGEVYRAHQLNLKRDVAIKVISQEFLESFNGDTEEVETTLGRFRREVQAMAQIRHANVLQIFDYGSTSINKNGMDVPIEYIVMEYIPGATLRFAMQEEGFYPDQEPLKEWLKEYFLPVLDGVQTMHGLGIVHRDLKPENVLLDGTTPKIADFGLARSSRMAPVTQSVDIKGTMPYMSPEHFLDFKKADQRADIYSLGKILFEAIVGKIPPETIPFKSASLAKADTPFLRKLDRIIQDATAEEKEDRIESVAELRKALIEAIDSLKGETAPEVLETLGRPSFLNQAKWIWSGIAVALISMLAMALWHLAGESRKAPVLPERAQISESQAPQAGLSEPSEVDLKSPPAPGVSLMGEDGIKMLPVPGGDLNIKMGDLVGQSKRIKLQAFYLDETRVSNHHFTEFLNEVKETLSVEEDAVRGEGGEIWLYLGEGTDPREQIVYRHDRFHLRDPKYAAQPVVRVTWYGARAYARHFSKRLPTEYEWSYGVQKGVISKGAFAGSDNKPSPGAGSDSSLSNHVSEMMRMHAQENRTTSSETASSAAEPVSGRVEGDGNVKEWVIRADGISGGGTRSEQFSYPSSVLWVSSETAAGNISKGFRYPWEGSIDVGFRCALSIGKG